MRDCVSVVRCWGFGGEVRRWVRETRVGMVWVRVGDEGLRGKTGRGVKREGRTVVKRVGAV